MRETSFPIFRKGRQVDLAQRCIHIQSSDVQIFNHFQNHPKDNF